MAKAPNPWTGETIRALRLALKVALKMTQAKAAEEVGVGQGVWSAWESGLRTPSRQSLMLLDLLNDRLGRKRIKFPK